VASYFKQEDIFNQTRWHLISNKKTFLIKQGEQGEQEASHTRAAEW
jgi:hypothetical protein